MTSKLKVDEIVNQTDTGSPSFPYGVTFSGTASATNLSYTGTLTGGTGVVNIGSGQFYKDASGAVGVGTTSPSSTLDIVGWAQVTTSNAAGAGLRVRAPIGSATPAIVQFTDNPVTTQWASISSLSAGTLAFTTNTTERMRIDSSGNVGIGTSSPASRLHVDNNGAADTVPLTVSNNIGGTNVASAGIDLAAHGVTFSRVVGGQETNGTFAQGNLRFFTRAAEVVAERMRIDSSGNVGIGTSSPGHKLDVIGRGRFVQDAAATTGAVIIRQDGTNTIGGYVQWVNNDNSAQTGYLGVLPDSTWVFGAASSERMRITSSGGVGIGTTSPGGKLGVETTVASDWPIIAKSPDRGFYNINTGTSGIAAYFSTSNGSVVAGQISVSGNTTTYNSASDYRLKNNIRPLSGGLDRIMRFKPCEWEWKSDGRVGVGFIAHEIQEERPQAVVGEKDEMDDAGQPVYQCMDSSVLIADLTAAIQELNAKVEAQAQEIAALKGA